MPTSSLRRCRALCRATGIAVFAVAAGAAAQPVADKPTFKVGDTWVYQQKTAPDKTSTWTRQITELAPDGGIRVQMGGTTQQFDGAWNYVDPRGPEFSRTTYKFPLAVGASWTFTNKTGTSVTFDQHNSYKVVGYEPVTVAAGTFDCYKVEGSAEASYKTAYQYQMKETLWYCPAVNAAAKIHRQSSTRTRELGASDETTDSELQRFTPGRQ
jgi:hypothetical protein